MIDIRVFRRQPFSARSHLFAVALISTVLMGSSCGRVWTTELVDPDLHSTYLPAKIAVGDGFTHILMGNNLLSRPEGGSSWTHSTIDSSYPYAIATGNGEVHIVGREDVNGGTDVVYLHRAEDADAGTRWKRERVKTQATMLAGIDPKIAIDTEGRVHVAFYNDQEFGAGSLDVVYAIRNRRRNWTEELITEVYNPSASYPHLAMDVDEFGGVHVLFMTDSENESHIMYAQRAEEGEWEIEEVAEARTVELNLVAHPTGLFASWVDHGASEGLGHRLHQIGSLPLGEADWQISDIAFQCFSGQSCSSPFSDNSLVVDPLGRVHLFYSPGNTLAAMHYSRKPNGTESYKTIAGFEGQWLWLGVYEEPIGAVDSIGNLHVAFSVDNKVSSRVDPAEGLYYSHYAPSNTERDDSGAFNSLDH